jgi:N-acetylglucosaminyldiphosphoundecaprenol N-acetyl-beta-D-mannosaminyltransferase
MSARATVLGCEVDRIDLEQALLRCEALIDARGAARHTSLNVAKLVAMQDNPRLRDIVCGSEVVTADGQPIVWASRLLGDPLPERVAGIDLMHALLPLAARKGYGVFILGARAEVLTEAVRRLRIQHPGIRIVGQRDGYFSESETAEVCAEIKAAQPHILFVAMGSPQKEYWIADHCDELSVPLSMGVGGAVDVIAGVTRRAPRWMQDAGLEWLYRLVQEPRRLAGRYVVTNVKFGLLLGAALLGGRRKPPAQAGEGSPRTDPPSPE